MLDSGGASQANAGPGSSELVEVAALRGAVSAIFEALGLDRDSASLVADSLVDAELEGVMSHGILLVPMYAERIRKGSVSLAAAGRVVRDVGAVSVIDAANALGQLTAAQAVAIAAAKADEFGLGAVAVRNAFHFGTAGRFASVLAARGHVGIVMCNTRPLIPAPGGAEAVVGNNPIAIAMPSAGDGPPIVLDMATSASAMGKIRMAAATGAPIPADWATDAQGQPTTDPLAAIKGMLLPVGGPKGFGLAFMIDLICGALSAGAVGDQVRPLYGDPALPYRCAHFFLAIHVGHFRDPDEFGRVTAAAAERVRRSRRAPGVEHVMSPGEPEWRKRQANGDRCRIESRVLDDLRRLGRELGVSVPGLGATHA